MCGGLNWAQYQLLSVVFEHSCSLTSLRLGATCCCRRATGARSEKRILSETFLAACPAAALCQQPDTPMSSTN